MPQDIYGVNIEYQTAKFFPSAHITFTIAGKVVTDMVVQNVQWTYGRQIQPVRSVGSAKIYQIAQPAQGQITFSKLASLGGNIKNLISQLSVNLNNDAAIFFQAGGGYGYKLMNLAIASFSMQANADSGFIQESTTLSYTSCEENPGAGENPDAQGLKDIYGVNTEYAPGTNIVRTKDLMLSAGMGSTQGQGLLIQNISLQYGRQIQPLKEISSGIVYNFALPAQGNLTIDRVVGDKALADLIAPDIYTNEDNGGSQVIRIYSSDNSIINYNLTGCVVASIGSSANANNYMITENVQIRFTSLF